MNVENLQNWLQVCRIARIQRMEMVYDCEKIKP